jgi:hypothetical protein
MAIVGAIAHRVIAACAVAYVLFRIDRYFRNKEVVES